jgi:D-alanine-D-alanine ligase
MKKIAILFGAKSFEHEISIVSAIAMKSVLKNQLTYIFIDRDRVFYHISTDIIKSKLFSSGEYKKSKKLNITQGGFEIPGMFGNKKLEFDVVLNLTHGGDGEDGKLASLLEFFNINYIGPRVEASVVSCNKFLTKSYANSVDVKTIDFQYFTKDDEITVEKYPVIIKPVRLGSSIGVSIVKEASELEYALDVAFEFDNEIIIEPFIEGILEYNLAGTKVDGKIVYSIVEEPQKEEFLDFDKKYLDFNRTSRVNAADISNELREKLEENFAKIYNTLFDGSLIRCDFFVLDGKVYLNEINSIPGSMGNYLFNDFQTTIDGLCNSLPKQKNIIINYEYVNKIQSAKGKA